MRVEIAELWPRPPVDGAPTSVDVDPHQHDPFCSALYLPVPRAARLLQLDGLVSQISPAVRRSAEAVVVRLHGDDGRRLRGDEQIVDALLHRVESTPCYTLEMSHAGHAITPLALAPPFSLGGEAALEKALRHAELAAMIRRPGVVLPKVEGFHYEGPNGTHFGTFLRAGLAMQTPAALDAVCFWLLPRLRQNTVVLLDTWGLMSLGLNLKLRSDGEVTRVESLQWYDEPTDEILERLRGPDGSLPQNLLLLISVSSTGALATRLREACHGAGCASIDVVSLFSSLPAGHDTAAAGEVFCRLGPEFVRVMPSECEACARGGSSVVKIEPTTYLMEISAAATVERITADGAAQAVQFFRQYKGTGCVSVHRHQHDKARHHMIHVDVGALLPVPTFLQRLEAKIAPLRGRVDAVLCPTHSVAVSLAGKAAGLLGLRADRLVPADESGLMNLSPCQRDTIEASRTILVVDDVAISGARLRGYRTYLQKVGLARDDRTLHFMVGVHRTWNTATSAGICDMAHGKDKFHPVEELLLPHWGDQRCPWCWELQMLDQLSRSDESFGRQLRMRDRHRALRDTVAGLKRDIFLHWGEDGARPFELGPQSVFGELHTDVEVFVTIANAIQRLRDQGQLSEHFTTPIARVLEPERVLSTRFYGQVIIASVLRAARPHDLRSTMTDPRLQQETSERLRLEDQKDLRSEILFAIARKHLPRVGGLLDRNGPLSGGEPGVAAFLKSILT